jgi:hypothetical protein
MVGKDEQEMQSISPALSTDDLQTQAFERMADTGDDGRFRRVVVRGSL